jgi:hypothetical protein
MAGELKAKYSGTWRTINGVEVNYSGSWREVKTIEVKSGGVWREVYTSAAAPVVTTSSANCWRSTDAGVAYANLAFNSDGDEYMNPTFPATSPATTVSRGTWLTSGSAADVWVERTIDSGSLSTDPGTGRHNLATTRTFGVYAGLGGFVTAYVTFKFYDAATGGNLLHTSASIMIRAQSYDE